MIGRSNADGGGGVISEDITVTKSDIPKGLTALTNDSDDEIVEGTLVMDGNTNASDVNAGKTFYTTDAKIKLIGTKPINGAINATLNCGQSKIIPAGDTTGGTVTASSLASQTSGTASAAKILTGQTAWVNGVKITGNIPTRGAATIMPGRTNQTIAANQCLTGTQTIMGDLNLVPANIKKGVTIFGVSGTQEGWVSNTIYIYNNGVWSNIDSSGMSIFANTFPTRNSFIQKSSNIALSQTGSTRNVGNYLKVRTNATVDVTNFKYLKMYMNTDAYDPPGDGYWSSFELGVTKNLNSDYPSALTSTSSPQTGTLICDITEVTGRAYLYIGLYNCGRVANGTCYSLYLTNV